MLSRGRFLGSSFVLLSGCARRGRGAVDVALAGFAGHCAVFAGRIRASQAQYCYERNADARIPAASLAKLLVAISVADQVRARSLHRDDVVRVSARVERLAGSEAWGLVHPRLTVSDLLGAMISISDNFASNALIELLGVEHINASALRLGLRVLRVHGYYVDSPDTVPPRTFATARDMLAILTCIGDGANDPEALTRGVYLQILDSMYRQDDRRIIRAALPPSVSAANKTGEIANVINDVAIIEPMSADPAFIIIMADKIAALNTASYEDEISALRRLARALYDECI